MQRALEILNASREELIAYLKSWNHRYKDTQPEFELRLMTHKNFRKVGPGMGPVPVVESAPETNAGR